MLHAPNIAQIIFSEAATEKNVSSALLVRKREKISEKEILLSKVAGRMPARTDRLETLPIFSSFLSQT